MTLKEISATLGLDVASIAVVNIPAVSHGFRTGKANVTVDGEPRRVMVSTSAYMDYLDACRDAVEATASEIWRERHGNRGALPPEILKALGAIPAALKDAVPA